VPRPDRAEHRAQHGRRGGSVAPTGHYDDAPTRIDRARHAARDNPIASTIIERAAAPIAVGDRSAVENLAATFARLGCPYQEARTRTLIRVAQAR
jgi:hypothetical protein